MTYTRTIEIEGPHENAVENFIHTVIKNANDGQRYGVELDVRRVDNHETDESAEFSKASE